MQSCNTNFVDYLITLAKDGRKRSFVDLCEINQQNIFTVVYRILLDEKISEKITIQTFLSAWKKIKEYESQKSFTVWLKELAIKAAVDELKKTDPEKLKVKKRIYVKNEPELLENMIISLSTQERVLFVLHDLEGYTYEEIRYFFPDMIIDEIRTLVISTRENLISKLSI